MISTPLPPADSSRVQLLDSLRRRMERLEAIAIAAAYADYTMEVAGYAQTLANAVGTLYITYSTDTARVWADFTVAATNVKSAQNSEQMAQRIQYLSGLAADNAEFQDAHSVETTNFWYSVIVAVVTAIIMIAVFIAVVFAIAFLVVIPFENS